MPLGADGQLELAEYACDVALEGVLAEAELIGNGEVGPPLGHAGEHVELALAQLVERARGSDAVQEPGDDRRIEDTFAVVQATEGIRQGRRKVSTASTRR